MVHRRDEDEFTAFVIGSQDRLRRTAYLLCGDWQRAADITQEALIRLYVAWPRLERKGGLPTYARRAVVSACIDLSRRRWSQEPSREPDEQSPDPHDAAEMVSDRVALMQALRRLPERQRSCVVLRYFEDLTVHETALVLECSAGNVKSQTSRALRSMRATFEADERPDLAASLEVGL